MVASLGDPRFSRRKRSIRQIRHRLGQPKQARRCVTGGRLTPKLRRRPSFLRSLAKSFWRWHDARRLCACVCMMNPIASTSTRTDGPRTPARTDRSQQRGPRGGGQRVGGRPGGGRGRGQGEGNLGPGRDWSDLSIDGRRRSSFVPYEILYLHMARQLLQDLPARNRANFSRLHLDGRPAVRACLYVCMCVACEIVDSQCCCCVG